MGLQHEHVRASHRLRVTHIHLAIGEIVFRGLQYVDSQLFRHIGGKLRMAPAGYEYEVFIRFSCEDCAHRISKLVD